MDELKYEPLDEKHAGDLQPIWADEDVIYYTNIKKPCSLTETIDKIIALKSSDVFVVSNHGGVVGIIGCPCIDRTKSQYGLFYHFGKSSWGRGYATKATEWMLNYMKAKYADAVYYADVVVNNAASEKILKNFGFVLISEEDEFEKNGELLKVRSYCFFQVR